MILSHLQRLVLNPAPGFAQLHIIIILHHDHYLPQIKFVPPLLTTFARGRREAAPVPFSNFIYRDNYSSTYQHCTAIAPAPNKTCTRIAKSTPYLSCHRDYFSAKVPGSVAGWLHQVTQPTLYCRAVTVNIWYPTYDKKFQNIYHIRLNMYRIYDFLYKRILSLYIKSFFLNRVD